MFFQSVEFRSATNPLAGPATPLASAPPAFNNDRPPLHSSNAVSSVSEYQRLQNKADIPDFISPSGQQNGSHNSNHQTTLNASPTVRTRLSTAEGIGINSQQHSTVNPSRTQQQQPLDNDSLIHHTPSDQTLGSTVNLYQKRWTGDATHPPLHWGQPADINAIDQSRSITQASLYRVISHPTDSEAVTTIVHESEVEKGSGVEPNGGSVSVNTSSSFRPHPCLPSQSNNEVENRTVESFTDQATEGNLTHPLMPNPDHHTSQSEIAENPLFASTKQVPSFIPNNSVVVKQVELFGRGPLVNELSPFRQSNPTISPLIRPSTTPNYLSMPAPGFFRSHNNTRIAQPKLSSTQVLCNPTGIASPTNSKMKSLNPSSKLTATSFDAVNPIERIASTVIDGSVILQPIVRATAQRRVLSAASIGDRRRYHGGVPGGGGRPYNVNNSTFNNKRVLMTNSGSPDLSSLMGGIPHVSGGANCTSFGTSTIPSEFHQIFIQRPQRRTFGEFGDVNRTTAGCTLLVAAGTIPTSSTTTTTVYGSNVKKPITRTAPLISDTGVRVGTGLPPSQMQQHNFCTVNHFNTKRATAYIQNQLSSIITRPGERYATAVVNTKNPSFFRNNQPHQVVYKSHPITIDPQTGTAVAYGRDPEKLLSQFLKEAGLK